MHETEEWRAIRGYDGVYEVSSFGRVRSLPRRTATANYRGKVLSPGFDEHGYAHVGLCVGGRARMARVHHLVLEAFVGLRPANSIACHFPDRDPGNNSSDNLRWGSSADNEADKKIHGTALIGTRNLSAKLTESDVVKIRQLRAAGHSERQLAKQFGVGNNTMHCVVSRKTWTHVPQDRR